MMNKVLKPKVSSPRVEENDKGAVPTLNFGTAKDEWEMLGRIEWLWPKWIPNCGTRTDRFGVTKPGKKFGNSFRNHVKKIAPDLSFHCFRHYSISEMANAGIPQEVRERIVGHHNASVHQAYTEIDIRVMKKAVDTIF